MTRIPLLLAMLLCLSACQDNPSADKVFIGKTWTGNAENEIAEAFAVADDIIVAVGTEEEIRRWIGKETEVIETQNGNLMVPGFIDCHTHFVDGGFALSSVQLRDARTRKEFIERIKTFAASVPQGSWITSGDWDHENWEGKLPSRDWIDSVTQNHPVWINRLDGHMYLANSRALSAAGITEEVEDVTGGTIVRDGNGRLTGIFKDNAMELVSRAVPLPSPEQEDQALEAAMNYVAAHGVTSIHNMSGYHALFERAHQNGKLKTRIYAGAMLKDWKELRQRLTEHGAGDEWLRIGNLKAFVDGSLGSHTASFFEPFTDSPADSGFFVIEEQLLYKRIKSADSAGLQLMVHAIGDRAINTLLNIYERISRENGERDRRFRIEHAQHIRRDDLPRFKKQNIIASMQPYHAIDDGRWAERVIGQERSNTTYAFKSLIDHGATVAFGSDWFVAPPDPLEGIYAAVTRRTLDERNPAGWVPQQKITVEEALRCYTINGAYASFEDQLKGSIEVGKLADFVVLEKDILSIPPEEISNVSVLMTAVGGKVVFRK